MIVVMPAGHVNGAGAALGAHGSARRRAGDAGNRQRDRIRSSTTS